MAGEGELDLEVEFPRFLADILDKTEIIFENFDSEVAEAHVEVLDHISCWHIKRNLRDPHIRPFWHAYIWVLVGRVYLVIYFAYPRA